VERLRQGAVPRPGAASSAATAGPRCRPGWASCSELRHAGSAVWQARFDDPWRTRLYIDARSGEFLAARNEAWVWYDFFWRLHLMDYGGGEDFNNPLLRTAAPLALGLVLTGGVLTVLALRRAARARRTR
jgi:uncharacterized iron-regulated membrane protein